MRFLLKVLLFAALFVSSALFSQQRYDGTQDLLNLDEDADEELEAEKAEKKADVLEKVNIDLQMVYGQYNNMLSIMNFSQEEDDFVYYLRSRYKRSNDFGYEDTIYDNSSYIENSLEFIGNVSFDDGFSTMFQAGVDVDSRGMFDKEDYSREEKEKVLLSSKNTKKFSSSFEAYFAVGGAFYKHRLEPRAGELEQVRNSLTRYTGETGGELIWSSANRLRFNALYSQYSYTEEDSDDDQFVKGEVVDDFKISDILGFNLGLNFAWNRDNGLFAWNVEGVPLPVMPIAGVTFYGNEFYTLYLNYRYDLQPFRPEEYYYEQNYIYPTYELPPAKVHHVDFRIDLNYKNLFVVKNITTFERSNNYYNYIPSDISENLLTAHSIDARILSNETDLGFIVVPRVLRLSGGYKYSEYLADENITYHPRHTFKNSIVYDDKLFHVEWQNHFLGEVFVLPDSDQKLDNAMVGYLDVQFKTIESFYAYLRLENLYNSRYYLRDGYPESGLTALMGLRILI